MRLLASSASLPIDGEQGAQSLAYLRDLFAPYGTSRHANDPGVTDPDFWRECIVVGNPHLPTFSSELVEAQPFIDLLEVALGREDGFVAKIQSAEAMNPVVAQAAFALGVSALNAGDRVKALAEAAAAVLTQACRDGGDVRATSTSDMAARIFRADSGDLDKALRGLLLALPVFPLALQAWGNNLAATAVLAGALAWHIRHPPRPAGPETAAALKPSAS